MPSKRDSICEFHFTAFTTFIKLQAVFQRARDSGVHSKRRINKIQGIFHKIKEPPVNRLDKHYCSDTKWPTKMYFPNWREILNDAFKKYINLNIWS